MLRHFNDILPYFQTFSNITTPGTFFDLITSPGMKNTSFPLIAQILYKVKTKASEDMHHKVKDQRGFKSRQ